MKKSISGKRFTKRQRMTYENNGEFLEFVNSPAYPAKNHYFKDFDAYVTKNQEIAQSILRKNGLPSSLWLYTTKSSPEDWQPNVPANMDDIAQSSNIERYVTKILKLPHDSEVGFAASIVVACDRAKNKNQEILRFGSLRLGRLLQAAQTYEIEARQNRKNSGRPRKKEWAVSLAKQLELNDPRRSFEWVWKNKIPESRSPLEIDEYEIYRDGDSICCDNDSLKKNSFRTNYWKKL